MNGAVDLLSMNRPERRAATLRTARALVAAAVVDLAFGFTPARLAVWAAWVGTYLVAAQAITRGPLAVAYGATIGSSFSSVAGLLALAWLGAGSTSPYFVFLVSVPLLMALIVPDDLIGAAVAGLFTLAGGGWLLRAEGRAWSDLARWAIGISVVVGLAVAATALHRRRQERALATEQARSTAVSRLAESERARLMAERWASIGLLADGVAHDVNSPLGSLRSNLAFAREELAAGRTAELDEALLDAQEGVERIREIVASLRAFSLSEVEAQERKALAEMPVPTPAPLPSRLASGTGAVKVRRPR